MALVGSAPLAQQEAGSTADAIKQDQQSVLMASARLVVKARSGVDNLFDDSGIEQLCRFRKGLMEDELTWKDYCLLVDDPEYIGSDEPPKVCSQGNDVMAMFYGDADYDIEQVDLSVFATERFDDIIKLYMRQPPDMVALKGPNSEFPRADVDAVGDLYFKLLGYLTGAWRKAKYVCDAAYKKDVPKVLAVLAHVREKESLDPFHGVLNTYFDKQFSVSNPVTKYTRGFYSYGAPLAGFDNFIDQASKEQQEAQYSRWWATTNMRSLYPEGKAGLALWPTGEPSLLNNQLMLSEILLVLLGDGLKGIAPVILVTLIVWLQTSSLLIAVITIIEILLSLTSALFVTAGMLQIKWVSLQSVLALYIVLAIGADDVFVFVDAYKQSYYLGSEVNQSLVHRMSWVYRRAGLAMLITSLTTCSAFVASAVSSPIPELQNFGIFAASVIAIDYLLVMTFLCANTIIFHNYLEMKPGLCCACCDDCFVKKDSWKCSKGGCTALCAMDKVHVDDLRSTAIAASGKAEKLGKKSYSVRFFEDEFPFNMIIKRLPTRLLSMALMIVLLILACISAGRLAPQTSTENFLPDNHPFQINIAANDEFEAANTDSTVEINMVWGFKEAEPIDQTGVSLIFDADFKGKVNYASGFELTPEAQTAILDVCDVLEAADATKSEVDTATGNTTVLVYCFMRTFRDYRSHKGLTFPISSSVDAAKGLEEWLQDDDTSIPKALLAQPFDTDIGWTKDSENLKLQWLKVRAASKISETARLPASQLREHYSTWEAVLAEANTLTTTTPLGKGFQQTGDRSGRDNKWIFMTVQEAYVRMALVGVGVGLGIAAIVLLVATHNLIVSLACIGTIAAALACVLGSIVAMGWKLGQNESLCMMVLTGFAVDYVVHLSHSYMESSSTMRLDRVHDALRDMGISVFWGMLTSMFAAGVLATCQIQFLYKFGMFFMMTILYAYLWSVLFLMPLLACIGPEPLISPETKFEDTDNLASEVVMSSIPPSPPASEPGDAPHFDHVKRSQTAPHIV